MASLNTTNILKAIRDNATDLYQGRVPQATKDNLLQVGKAISSDTNIMNEFISALINKIAFTDIKSRLFKNPLSVLKSGSVPFGNNIEEIFINPATDMGYQKDGTYLLKTTTPDGKTAYYGQNRQGCYAVSISQPQLNRAFTSEQEFMSFYNSIVSSLYSGDNIDEFILMKRMLSLAVEKGNVLMMEDEYNDYKTNPKRLAKDLSNLSKNFTFPSSKYCGYNLVNADKITAGEKPCVTFCPVENQVLIIKADTQTEIDYEVLATMFHVELAKLEAMTILVDDFPTIEEIEDTGGTKCEIKAILLDKSAIQVRDAVYRTEVEFIKSNLTWNIWLHHWEHLFLSMFGNAVAFIGSK